MNKTEWLEARRAGIGGSDAAAVLGASRWKTGVDVWLEKIGEAQPIEENAAMRWGTRLEPVIRAEYAATTGKTVLQPEMIFSPEYPWMIANLDGLTDDRVVEIKTARSADAWGEPGTDEVPIDYAAQVHHYMIVTGRQMADIAVLIGGSDFRIYTVHADPELHQSMIERERQFWQQVEAREMPEIQDVRDALTLFKRDNGLTIEATDQIAIHAAELADVKAQIKEADAIKEILEGSLKLFMGPAANLEYNGNLLATWKAAKDGTRFDEARLKADLPDLWAEYQKTVPGSRRFLLK